MTKSIRSMLLVRLGALLGLSTLAACALAPDYYYAPEAATVTRAGVPIQSFAVPPEGAQGYVDVSTSGIVRTPRGDLALHVRMEVANNADATPWSVDVRNQLVDIPGVGQSRPLSANAGFQALPTLTVARRDHAVVDLYYPLPPSVHDAEDLSGFDFVWQVTTAEHPVSGRAHVGRFQAQDASLAPVVVAPWGPYWWYDPLYPHVYYRAVFPHRIWHRW